MVQSKEDIVQVLAGIKVQKFCFLCVTTYEFHYGLRQRTF
jgi:hypothetical protein